MRVKLIILTVCILLCTLSTFAQGESAAELAAATELGNFAAQHLLGCSFGHETDASSPYDAELVRSVSVPAPGNDATRHDYVSKVLGDWKVTGYKDPMAAVKAVEKKYLSRK